MGKFQVLFQVGEDGDAHPMVEADRLSPLLFEKEFDAAAFAQDWCVTVVNLEDLWRMEATAYGRYRVIDQFDKVLFMLWVAPER